MTPPEVYGVGKGPECEQYIGCHKLKVLGFRTPVEGELFIGNRFFWVPENPPLKCERYIKGTPRFVVEFIS